VLTVRHVEPVEVVRLLVLVETLAVPSSPTESTSWLPGIDLENGVPTRGGRLPTAHDVTERLSLEQRKSAPTLISRAFELAPIGRSQQIV
jgi:hypothetical protein